MAIRTKYIFLTLCFLLPLQGYSWGFYAHQRINRLAVFALPPEMVGFYKKHIRYITENAVNPDKRRYAVANEAPRHYIDLDVYGDSALYKMPRFWQQAIDKYTEDTLQAYGIVPWHINFMKYQLTQAFKERNVDKILRLSAELGHYVADACVPLHTTQNYNGQLTGQRGIHGFWESRLPELFSDNYDFFVGQAQYIEQPQLKAWDLVASSHLALDSVFSFERQLTQEFDEEKKYSFEVRNNLTTRVYSRAFSQAYSNKLNGQVERQMRLAIKMTASYWYTAWVDAGQPNLGTLKSKLSPEELHRLEMEKKEYETGNHKPREEHDH
ncbi:zinc dependent phospholipase C family protein [Pontibacter cellulosilyticus]|uniref:Zinc dependent phospholipase C family protein n=1 Tax=Pontibacter cellulosilyticus TaxID=1720253 RepID=A0A923N9V0_9BACT|nr:zinc dependent phospholipase C family protein [Pontibacter cellulosilyticus]MBC5994926.1 zinc dependent phospholipase C family protein [Pontibacter cellulosilyticus]